ncbi:hypothetical protein HETIRDRAFT_422622 [Heterobasidion irregulare TC 32-1]|uniref:Uncharacterized protein n=1 Tax=Heterobasidion irregulare (strain TC 32-1) TaxID=747525 RepID=W4JRV3_HETIT|nr:uncharacterized protein HETIRDRAFT_422622 [Heterobasidion irregulare TC 32-1]ETW76277.1 hypothetical protein HETIRDRAFT_422622 [Heterobasidion irregulare TC 32-1]
MTCTDLTHHRTPFNHTEATIKGSSHTGKVYRDSGACCLPLGPVTLGLCCMATHALSVVLLHLGIDYVALSQTFLSSPHALRNHQTSVL